MRNENKLEGLLLRFTQWRRDRYKQKKQKKLKNTAPTIIGNNCVCGGIYRDLGLKYHSPTANVLIPPEDFFRFVGDLEYYLGCIPEEVVPQNAPCPAGVLKKGDEQVLLLFMHDKSFEEGKEKWLRRCARVDLDNLYIVFQILFPRHSLRLHRTNSWYRKLKALPYPNKRILVNTWLSFDKEVVPLSKLAFFKKNDTLQYPTKYSKKRLMDQFDYVSFLNNKCK